eukprot:4624240-Amphidinium_carterae.1
MLTPPRNVQRDIVAREDSTELVLAQRVRTITVPWSFFASLLMTILLCVHYSYFGSTISPLATVRQSLETMDQVPAPGDPQFADFVTSYSHNGTRSRTRQYNGDR